MRFEDGGRAIAILPGLSCRGKTGAPDVMRGEETQILGALRLHPELAKGRHLFCLPGTHAKWVAVTDGAVSQFQTALSGELFELLRRHSVLARDSGEVDGRSAAFALGLDFARQKADLLHLLFSTRSRVVTGEMAKAMPPPICPAWCWARMSQPRWRCFDSGDGPVHLVCTPLLAALYAQGVGFL